MHVTRSSTFSLLNLVFFAIFLLLGACKSAEVSIGEPRPKRAVLVIEDPEDTEVPDDTGDPPDVDDPDDTDTTPEVGEDNDSDDVTPEEGDCDDSDPTAYPDSPYDVLTDGFDQNCDGVDGVDGDADGYATHAGGGDDCDDEDPSTYPGATEVPYDGIANDCSGGDDLTDVDGDGYDATAVGGTDCQDLLAEVNPSMLEDNSDGFDNNCNGITDGRRFSLAWDYPGVEGNMGFTATIADSAEGDWTLELDYNESVVVEDHTFATTCNAPWVESAAPSGGCVGTHLDDTDAASGRLTYVLVAPTGDCWAWGADPTSTGCTVEDATTW